MQYKKIEKEKNTQTTEGTKKKRIESKIINEQTKVQWNDFSG